jgi:RND superfamily putative drug exporter
MSSPRPFEPKGALARWARFTVHNRGKVLLGLLGLVIAIGVISSTAGGKFVNSFKVPGVESQTALDLLEERFPSQAGGSAQVVFKTDAGVDDAAVKQQIDDVLAKAATLPEVVGVISPYDTPSAISEDRKIAYATVNYSKQANEVEIDDAKELIKLVEASTAPGFTVEAGGDVALIGESVEPFGTSELIGIAAAIIILLIAFGSVIAMGMPIIAALFGLGAGVMTITIAAKAFDMSEFTPSFAAMIGLGVGIDYSLFVVTRFREGLGNGLSVEQSVIRAIDTAGRAVAFAGTVVIIALLGLAAIGIPFVFALGLAGAIVVFFAIIVALTLTPALLSYIGRRIDKWAIPGLHTTTGTNKNSFWYRWSHQIAEHPWRYTLISGGILIFLTLPIFDVQLGFTDSGNLPEDQHTRRAYDILAEGFGPGFNGPLLLTIENMDGLNPDNLSKLADAIRQDPGVAAVNEPFINPENNTAVMTIIPTTSPQDQKTVDLVHHLRDDVFPPAIEGTGMKTYLGGLAAIADVSDKMINRMPLFFLIVIGLSIILLAAVFRSVVIPLKAALMNLLSIGSTFGILIAIFQWGWLKDVVGIAKEGPIEVFLPMMLFAILFGLSMDYEVFLLSRIREDYVHNGHAREAVANGLSATARVIAAAAAIMVCVFFSFVLGPDRIIKEFGIGLSAAIFIDATIVRLVLVPATMELLGEWNWWFPRWLDRLLPRLNVEGEMEPLPTKAD